jgi:hypothetical protein
MFKELLRKERQKLWLAAAPSANEIPAYTQALVSRAKRTGGSLECDTASPDLGEYPRWSEPHDILVTARAASGL